MSLKTQRIAIVSSILILLIIVVKWNIYSEPAEPAEPQEPHVFLDEYKTILAYDIPSWMDIPSGVESFKLLKCPEQRCRVTRNTTQRESADCVLFHYNYVPTRQNRRKNQIYALYFVESPPHTNRMPYPDIFNWTITYRYDSTIPTPYRTWKLYDPNVTQIQQNRNFAKDKTKKVAWFVSNCNDKNGRLNYARELQKHIEVDIYGGCGTLECPRSDSEKCYDLLDKDYKFYLAFENSNCKGYITEKLFENALQRDVLPIVMGAPLAEYENYAPQRSFIHVDQFESPMKLAEYLHELDQNDDLYNSYFAWKGTGVIEPYSMGHLCKMCSMLHDEKVMSTPMWYKDINEWWRGPGICTSAAWPKA